MQVKRAVALLFSCYSKEHGEEEADEKPENIKDSLVKQEAIRRF